MLGGRGGCIAAIVVEARGPRRSRWGRTKKIRRAGRGFVHSAGRLSASALASRLVRPLGAASSYSRAVLGARGNVWPLRTCRKGGQRGKTRNLRSLNSQHFHSPLCILWITPSDGLGPREGPGKPASRSSRHDDPGHRLGGMRRPRWAGGAGGAAEASVSGYLT